MNYQIVSKFFNTPVIIVVRGHVMEGVLTEVNQLGGAGIVGLTSIPGLGYDGYVQAITALVELESIDVIRPLTAVVST
jgi:hypothetical protein